MKKWEKICLIASVVCFAITSFIYVQKICTPQKRICLLCDMIPHHAPCLVDLETGELVGLGFYLSHDTLGGELADYQPYSSYFSFICIGDLVGYLTTDPPIVEIDIPANETFSNPTLCETCFQLLDKRYNGRYIVADVYDLDAIQLYPIENGTSFSLRCYEIDMTEKEEIGEITVTVRGTLGTEEPTEDVVGTDYVGNKNTKKFHYDWCSSVDKMKESNKYYYNGTREEMIAKGYEPCKNCDP